MGLESLTCGVRGLLVSGVVRLPDRLLELCPFFFFLLLTLPPSVLLESSCKALLLFLTNDPVLLPAGSGSSDTVEFRRRFGQRRLQERRELPSVRFMALSRSNQLCASSGAFRRTCKEAAKRKALCPQLLCSELAILKQHVACPYHYIGSTKRNSDLI